MYILTLWDGEMSTQLLVVLLIYIGIPVEAACIIAFIVYLIFGLLVLGALISIINIGTYTKRSNEQNEQLIEQNQEIINQNRTIIQQFETLSAQQYTKNAESYGYNDYANSQTDNFNNSMYYYE